MFFAVSKYKTIMDNNNQDLCCVCLETNTTHAQIRKWTCSHSFHEECIDQWDNGCPMCRNMELITPNVTWTISRNPRNVLNIDVMKSVKSVPENFIDIYKNIWKDQDCINENHSMVYSQPYGVVVICEDCNTVQCFKLMHRVIPDEPENVSICC